ncbi:hypothetical protein HK101_011857 [Irineochytrium annulatum]|nr:hypothetical protein HK101_011857 [Irineochytrium annulatum]
MKTANPKNNMNSRGGHRGGHRGGGNQGGNAGGHQNSQGNQGNTNSAAGNVTGPTPKTFQQGDFPRPKGQWSKGPPPLAPPASNGPTKSPAANTIYLLLAHLVGQNVSATVKEGLVYEGILHAATFTPELGVVLQKAYLAKDGPLTDKKIEKLVILPADLMTVSKKEAIILSSSGGDKGDLPKGFQTDSAISGRGGEFGRERELMKWSTNESTSTLTSWDDDKGDGKWDQFSTNERLFGVTTDFDEGLYTTEIDKSDPSYKKREQEAIRIAKEMESSQPATDNAHLLEERGLNAGDEAIDEEEKYSSVVRAPGKYVPPGARSGPPPPAPGGKQANKKSRGGHNNNANPPHIDPAAATKHTQHGGNQSLPSPGVVKPNLNGAGGPAGNEHQHQQQQQQHVKAAPKPNVSTPNPQSSNAPGPASAAPSASSQNMLPPGASASLNRPGSGSAANADGRDRLAKGGILSKLPVSGADPSAKDPINEVSNAFNTFAKEERKAHPKPLFTKSKEEVINEFKNFSSKFKLNTAIPDDIATMLKKDKDGASSAKDAKPSAAPVKEGPAPGGKKQDVRRANPSKPAPSRKDRYNSDSTPSAVAEAPESTASAEEQPKAAPKFKLSADAMEFKPGGGPPSAGITPARVKSPAHDKQRPASVAGTSSKGPGGPRNTNYNKNYTKNGQVAAKPANPGAPAYPYNQQQYRPQYPVQEFPEGVYVSGMDPNQQYYSYTSIPGHYPYRVPMMPRPFVPGMPPQLAIPGPNGAIPAYVPYMQPYPPHMQGYPQPHHPHMMGPPMPGAPGAPPPQGPPHPQQGQMRMYPQPGAPQGPHAPPGQNPAPPTPGGNGKNGPPGGPMMPPQGPAGAPGQPGAPGPVVYRPEYGPQGQVMSSPGPRGGNGQPGHYMPPPGGAPPGPGHPPPPMYHHAGGPMMAAYPPPEFFAQGGHVMMGAHPAPVWGQQPPEPMPMGDPNQMETASPPKPE